MSTFSTWRGTTLHAGAAQPAVSDQLPPEPDVAGATAQDLREALPDALKAGEIFGLEYWQWLGLASLIVLAVLVDGLLRPVFRSLLRRWLGRWSVFAGDESRGRAARPIALVAATVLAQGLLPLLAIPGRGGIVLGGAAAVLTVLAGIWAAWRVVDLLGEVVAHRAAATETRFDDVLVPMLRRAAKLFVVAVGVVYVAEGLDVEIAPLLASLGIGSLAFAFAAKDTIENFFGSVAVLVDRPFEVGDWVVVEDIEGTVETVGFRSTRVRTFYDSVVTLPNATLVRAKVDNYGRRRYRRIKTHVGLAYGTPPESVHAFCEGVRELVRTHPYTRKDYYQVWLHQLGASSLDVLLYVFIEAPDWSTELRERERLFLDVLRLADQLGVEIAFPTQTLHLHQAEGAASPPPEPPGSTTEEDARRRGIEAVQRLVARQPWRERKPDPVVLPPADDLARQDDLSGEG